MEMASKWLLDLFLEVLILQAPETFALVPPDFNRQNILVDEDGNVTGLIDWCGVCTEPRPIGYAITPQWLNFDWFYSYGGFSEPGCHGYELEHYRKLYAEYMAEALGGEDDCIYTEVSHLWQALLSAIKHPDQTQSIIEPFFATIFPRDTPRALMARIALFDERASPLPRDLFKQRVTKLFEPTVGPKLGWSF
jgi:hypothetical protein